MSEELMTKIRDLYTEADQNHVLRYLPTLSDTERDLLLTQLDSIDVASLASKVSAALETEDDDGSPIAPFGGQVGSTRDPELVESCRRVGLSAIAEGSVCALVLAGGQGTRLGFDGPKGMYSIGLPSGKTLFQLVAERIKKLSSLASAEGGGDGCVIPFYIMTSPMNDEETRNYFKSNDYFGLSSSDVIFFSQGVLPCLSDDKSSQKILMETPFKCAIAPDGNGGVYGAMLTSGVADCMERRGIQYVHVFSIDNALVRPADPVFIGYCIQQNADVGNKVCWKKNPHEKVGVVVEKNGKPRVIEYSDIDPELTVARDPDTNELVFGAANICNHLFTLRFLKDTVFPRLKSIYHIASKKIPVYDPVLNETITPTENNGIKLETFIFDVFPLSSNMAILDVSREEEFAPVKNKPGSLTDSPDTARDMISTLAKVWVRNQGVVLEEPEGVKEICEISPLVSYAGEGIKDVLLKKGNCQVQTCPFQL